MNKYRRKQQQIYKKQQKEIEKIYKDISNKIDKKLETLTEMSLIELQQLKKEIQKDIKGSNKKILKVVESSIEISIENTAKEHNSFYKNIDKKYNTEFYKNNKVDTEAIKTIVLKTVTTGDIYKDKLSLSKRIWGSNKKVLADIDRIINEGIKEKKHPLTIAKELEKYVNPSAMKDHNWKKMYPNCNIKVDYNAQRLARTSLTHAHQVATAESVKRNPLLDRVQYNSSHSSRTCPTCSDRDGQVYKADDFPLDHPNGNCYMTVYIPDDIDDIIKEYMKK